MANKGVFRENNRGEKENPLKKDGTIALLKGFSFPFLIISTP